MRCRWYEEHSFIYEWCEHLERTEQLRIGHESKMMTQSGGWEEWTRLKQISDAKSCTEYIVREEELKKKKKQRKTNNEQRATAINCLRWKWEVLSDKHMLYYIHTHTRRERRTRVEANFKLQFTYLVFYYLKSDTLRSMCHFTNASTLSTIAKHLCQMGPCVVFIMQSVAHRLTVDGGCRYFHIID